MKQSICMDSGISFDPSGLQSFLFLIMFMLRLSHVCPVEVPHSWSGIEHLFDTCLNSCLPCLTPQHTLFQTPRIDLAGPPTHLFPPPLPQARQLPPVTGLPVSRGWTITPRARVPLLQRTWFSRLMRQSEMRASPTALATVTSVVSTLSKKSPGTLVR